MEFSVLGPLVVRAGDDEVRLAAAKPRVLLARLLLDANRSVPAERLVDDVWDGEPPRSAAQTLQSYVSQLRKLLGADRLVTDVGGYRLVVRDGELDRDRFDALVAQGVSALRRDEAAAAVDALDTALGLWRGDAFVDAVGAAWAAAETARLEELRIVATEALLEGRLALHDDGGVIAAAEAAVAEHPLRERLWALLMTALYRQGRQADALRAYQRVRRHLGEELGIEPGRDLQDLEARMLRQDPALAAPPAAPAAERAGRPPSHRPLPTGVVTFMLTDVVGSTRLWESAPRAMGDAIARHEELLRAAVETHHGILLKSRGEGDSTFSVFQRATDAVAAAVDAQAALHAEAWPTPSPIEVRLALHTGEAVERDGDYYGRTVNRAARLRAAAVPDRVVVSQATAELVFDDAPDGYRLQELGVQQLRDLDRPETLYLVVRVGEVHQEDARTSRSGIVPVPSRLAAAPTMGFVGRERERDVVARALKDATAAGLRVVLLTGEPGIGKSALAAQAAADAHAGGATVLFGRCDDDAGVPYRPWVEALGHYVEHAPRSVLDRVGERAAADLVPLVRAVTDRVPGAATPRSPDPQADRWSLYGAVARLLVEASRDAPVVLVLDDLQWADKPSLVLLRHVVDVARDAPLLVVGTYRDSDLTADQPFADALTWLRRDAVTERVALRGLGDRDVVALVEGVTGQELGDAALALVQAVYRETDGNPFFVEALLRHLAESGAVFLDDAGRWTLRADVRDAGLPESIREVVGRRVARLGDACRRVLDAASVVGREFDLATVAAALGADEDDVLDALEVADGAGLITSVAPGRFAFAHAIVATTLYTGVTTTRRARLHRDVAEAIEATDPDGERVAELARHWAAATAPDDRTKAVEYARRAGDRARRALAPDEAVRWYAQALELSGAAAGDDAVRGRADLLVRLGRAQRDIGDPAHRATLVRAAQLAQEVGDGDLLTRAALANTLGFVGVIDPESGARIAALRAALAASSDGDSISRARLLATLATETRFFDDAGAVRRLVDEALAMARRLGTPHLLLATLTMALPAIWGPDTLEERLRLSEEAVALAVEVGDRGLSHMAATWRMHALVEAGRVDEAARTLAQMADIAAETRQPNLQWPNRAYRASLATLHGALEEAEQLAAEAVASAVPDAAFDPHGINRDHRIAMAWHRGSPEAELEAVGRRWARDAAYDEEWRDRWSPDLISDSGASVDDVFARFRVVARAHHHFVEAAPDPTAIRAAMRETADLDPAVTQGWTGAMVLWADVCTRLGRDDDAAHLLERLAPYHDQVASTFSTWYGSIAGAIAPLAARLGRLDDAERWFAEAEEMNTRIRAPFFLARNRVAWARMLLARGHGGDADRAGELLRSALEVAREHGCDGVVRDAESLLAAPPPLPPRVASSARASFVGRTSELATLERAVADGGAAVLVAGEPGIGKSTLVAAAAASARSTGAWVLYGRCDEDLRVPFLPFVEALGALVAHASDTTFVSIGERQLAELARLVPAVRDRRPALPPPQSTDPETERYLLMNAVVAALVEAARVAPVVLVLDDLHWADASTVLLVRHLVTALPGSRVTVLATYRHTDLFADAPLTVALARLRREGGVRHLVLAGLSPAELAELTGAEPDLADQIHRETDGNPFFADELFRHVQQHGDDVSSRALPDTVRGLVRQRVGHLGEDVVSILVAASAVGQEFDLELLARVVEREPLVVVESLERAEAAALVTTVAPERFAFSHAIVQHALYDELTPTRRARTHRAVAAALTELSTGDDRITELARHWAAGAVTPEDVALAVDCAARAAARALEALAPDEAVRWYTSALELLARQPVPDQQERLRVLLGLADAQVRVGDPEFRRTRLQAGDLAIALDDTDALVRAALTNYQRAFTMESDPELIRLYEVALDRLGDVDSEHRALLLARYADAFQFSDPVRCVELGRVAVTMARRIGADVSTLVHTITFGGIDADLWQEAAARTEEAYELARDAGDPSVLFQAAHVRSFAALPLCNRDAADEAVAITGRIAAEIARPDMRWVAMMDEAVLVLLDGDLRRAEELADAATVLGRELRQDGAELMCGSLLTGVRWHQGRHQEVRDVVSSNAAATPDLQVLRLPVTMDDASGFDLHDAIRALPKDAAWLPGAAILAEIVARVGDPAAARALYQAMLPHRHMFAIIGPNCRGAVAHALAVLARTFGDLDAADAHFAAADAINERMRAPFFRARTWLEWGSLLADAAPERAQDLLTRALEVARRHGYAQVERRTRRRLAEFTG